MNGNKKKHTQNSVAGQFDKFERKIKKYFKKKTEKKKVKNILKYKLNEIDEFYDNV